MPVAAGMGAQTTNWQQPRMVMARARLIPASGRRIALTAVALGAAFAVVAIPGGREAQGAFPDDKLLSERIDACFASSPVGEPFAAALPIPPVKEPAALPDNGSDVYVLSERRGEAEIIPGVKTPIWGYDGITPGPTILARKGRPVQLAATNDLPPDNDPGGIVVRGGETPHHSEPPGTAIHLHGVNASHSADGYPDDGDGHVHVRHPGDSGTHEYQNNDYQRPATMWYHDHVVHGTSNHLYRGLAAMYIVQDWADDALRLPGSPLADGPGNGYGVFDIPLVVKDVMIDPATGRLLYDNCDDKGAYGDVMTVNGKQQPRFSVANRKYRFRMLDASDARQYLVALRLTTDVGRPTGDRRANQPFTLIGTDQGLLPAPEPVTALHMVPAERHEFVVDFSRYPIGTRLVLVNLLADPGDEKSFPLMAFDVERAEADPSEVRAVLRPAEHPADTQAPVRTRTFRLDRSGGMWTIDGRTWDPLRDAATPAPNTVEDWVLVNKSGGWGHPFHPHLGRFRVIAVNGRPVRPGELAGFKDTVWVGPNQTVRIRMQFYNFDGRFPMHCHNGSHEDADMMAQFNVRPAR
jgi:FtsP/CotA-like multicopper oxidase with cupredoxin domain